MLAPIFNALARVALARPVQPSPSATPSHSGLLLWDWSVPSTVLSTATVLISLAAFAVSLYALRRTKRQSQSANLIVASERLASEPASTVLTITNTGPTAARNVELEICIDDRPVWPFVSHQSPFPLKDRIAGDGGRHPVIIDIPPDNLSSASAILRWQDGRPGMQSIPLAISPPIHSADTSDVP